MKNKEVIQKILDYHPYIENYEGCDGYKSGSGEDECTGVAVALVPTLNVLQKAAEAGCNLVLVHEPTNYEGPDYAEWKEDYSNQIYDMKYKMINENHLTIYRDHDHMHFHNPDSIFTGVMKELGWLDYYQNPDGKQLFYYPFKLPETTVGKIADHLKEKLNLHTIRTMGNPDDVVSKVAIVGHLCPNCFSTEGIKEDGYFHSYSSDIIKAMDKDGIEVIIPGEIVEWTTMAYIRDALYFGRKKACLNIGHFNMEELGMKDFAKVINKLLDSKIKVQYIPTEDNYKYI